MLHRAPPLLTAMPQPSNSPGPLNDYLAVCQFLSEGYPSHGGVLRSFLMPLSSWLFNPAVLPSVDEQIQAFVSVGPVLV